MHVAPNKKVYFASDVHLGLFPREKSDIREKHFVQWLDEAKKDAAAIFLVGDIFDFWYEYKKVVPRGFIRFLGKLAEITDSGIPVHYFAGNHDIWVNDYLIKEAGVILHLDPYITSINGKTFYIAHGDGLGPGDYSYKILRRIFTNPVMQFLFSRIHPNLAFGFGHWWSKQSRYSKGLFEEFLGTDKEFLILYAQELLKKKPVDYFIFGHRHIPMEIEIGNSRLINLGEWISAYTYGSFDGEKFNLLSYKNDFDPSRIIKASIG
ncbi:MAG TPA: UDP-2,3-diacylglucosamine diphosphatase [Bacteroidales bacterium]|nr:UDP-2,3-diacylglucosamine diphosphatase [Bacteroidales bacterium]